MSDETEKQKKELLNSLLEGDYDSKLNPFSDTGVTDEKIDDERVDEYIKNFGSHKVSDFLAYVPNTILNNAGYSDYLYGITRTETESFYVLEAQYKKYPIIGYIGNNNENIPDNLPFGIIIIRHGNEFVCKTTSDEPVRLEPYEEQATLFSRNSGLLISNIMLNKCAIIIGCGSVGSFIAMELARSGIGKFVLCDTDVLEIHNICRHQCGIDDLGRYKVDAVRDKILNINPKADVTVFRKIVQRIGIDALLPYLGVDSIVIGTGDNRESSEYACDNLAIPTDTSFVAACCWTRAFAGEVIYWTAGKNLPCYHCALGDLPESEQTIDKKNYWKMDKSDNQVAFEPAIAVDIDFVSLVAIKIILDLLNKETQFYAQKVINYLTQYTWICNTNDPKIGGEKAMIFSHPLQITHTLKFKKKNGCKICGDKN